MEDYGIPGALILREFPFSFRGNTEALEPGEIICSLEKDRLQMELKNVSGREFQELCDPVSYTHLLLVGALSFFPALSLGPIAEHLGML